MSDLIAIAYPEQAAATRAPIVLVRELIPEKVLPHIHEPGRVIHASVGREVTARLDAALGAAEHSA